MQQRQKRHASRPLFFALLVASFVPLSGCGFAEDVPAGEVSICFNIPNQGHDPDLSADGNVNASSSDISKALDGTVVFDKPMAETQVDLHCRDSATRVLQLDVAGELWSVGYGATDGNGQDITPEVAFSPGQSMHLALETSSPWGTYFAFSARSEDGVLLAMNDGFAAQLPADSVEGLSVTPGEATGTTEDDDCGTRAAHELRFRAKSSVNLDGGESSPIELNDGSAQVMNIAAWDYEEQNCEDIWGPDAWMAWRASPL